MNADTRIIPQRAIEDPWIGAATDLSKTRGPRRRPSRFVRLLGIPLMGVIVVVAAASFSSARSVQEVAAHGEQAVLAEAAQAAALQTRDRVLAAGALARERDPGSATPPVTAAAVRSVRSGVAGLIDVVDDLTEMAGGELGAVDRRLGDAVGAVDRALELIEDGSPAAASSTADARVALERLAIVLVAQRDAALGAMEAGSDVAGIIATVAQISVVLLIPTITVFGYRFLRARSLRNRRLEAELDEERRMVDAKDELIANISHELRTPLTAILGFSQEAAIAPSLTEEELRSMAGVVASEADELARMVDDLITTARDNESSLVLAIESVDPNDELNAVQLPASIAGRNIEIYLPPVKVRADPLRLRQILRNLVSNALKYGGPTVALEGVVKDGVYYLTVIDDGDGVPAPLAERLFTPFVHTGDAPIVTGSVGLGLAIAHRLATVMDGTLIYERRNGKTHFTLGLPVAREGDASTVKVG